MSKKIVAATRNRHKVEEFRDLLASAPGEFEIVGLDEFPACPDCPEDGQTFEENAAKKALAASEFCALPAFADDSGLEVEALDGRPGIHSARYAGDNATNDQRIAKLLSELEAHENRRARFVCVIAIAFNGEIINSFRGEVAGTITKEPRGENGFGYDPVFIPDGFAQTFGELPADIKNRISHRARAVQQAIDFIDAEMAALGDFDLI